LLLAKFFNVGVSAFKGRFFGFEVAALVAVKDYVLAVLNAND
jgi:hypothetical protein